MVEITRTGSGNITDRRGEPDLMNFYRMLYYGDPKQGLIGWRNTEKGYGSYNPINMATAGYDTLIGQLLASLNPAPVDLSPREGVNYSDPALAEPFPFDPRTPSS